MIYDVITYNGEKDILDLRLNILSPYVDRFIIVEAKTTFSGNKKPLYFSAQEHHFRKFWNKITYYIVKENYTESEVALAESSPNTRGAHHWKNEFLQKESIKKAILERRIQDDDIVYIGDVDEIWTPYDPIWPAKLKLLVYAYYLDNQSSEEFWGPVVAYWGDIKDKCLNHVRTDISLRTNEAWGWHFTSMGGIREVSRKISDSYTAESYNTPQVQKMLTENVQNGTDYLGRPFKFKISEEMWPEYLKENRMKYEHLCISPK
jgi:beta-1,4-mannosyl-glycoprotein beta-1,4-N-acetylglucosaminyltransferase